MFVSSYTPALRLRRWLRQLLWCACVILSLLLLARSGAPNTAQVLAADGEIPNEPTLVVPATSNDFYLPGTQPEELGKPGTDALVGCTGCHVDHISVNYAGSMMANSARDPLFRAALEVANKDVSGSGEFCIRCHVPNAWLNGRAFTGNAALFQAQDMAGVTCNVCHRSVAPHALDGETDRNPNERDHIRNSQNTSLMIGSGSYIIDRQDWRRGPYDLVVNNHGDGVKQDSFMQSALMCSTCHEIDNPLLTFNDATEEFELNEYDTPAGVGAKLFPIERTYSEWANSAFNTPDGVAEISDIYPGLKRKTGTADGPITVCQDCHMPMIESELTTLGTPVRKLGTHDWAGGSSLWQQGIEAFWGDVAGDTLFNATAEAATLDSRTAGREMLARAAELDITVEDRLLTITVTNNTGHKLPTGYAEGRQMWLEVIMFADTQVISRLGELDENGNIMAPLKIYEIKLGLTEDHAEAVGRPEIAGEGFHFVLNNKVFKDNRIPPRGWTLAQYETKSMEPVGATYADGQYSDTTTVLLPIGVDEVDVKLWYQTASGEYLDFLEAEATGLSPDGVVGSSVVWGEVVGTLRRDFDLDRGEEMAFTGTAVAGLALEKQFSPSSDLLPGQPITITIPFTNTSLFGVGNVGLADTILPAITNVTVETALTGGTTLNQTGNAPNLAWTVNGELAPGLDNKILIKGLVNPQISADTVINNSALMSGSVGLNEINRSAQASATVVVPRVQFAPSSYEAEEDADPLEIAVTMDKVNPYAPTTFAVSTLDGSAKAGKDFVALTNHQVVIPAGQSSGKFTVQFIDDEQGENDESFAVVLTGATAAAVGVTTNATITIENEDDGPVVFEDALYLPGVERQ